MSLADFYKNGELHWQIDVEDWREVYSILCMRNFEIFKELTSKSQSAIEFTDQLGNEWRVEVKDWMPDQ